MRALSSAILLISPFYIWAQPPDSTRARLGEGIVNGLMTVRVGIAAMRVVRPLPFEVQRQPVVRDLMSELANVLQKEPER